MTEHEGQRILGVTEIESHYVSDLGSMRRSQPLTARERFSLAHDMRLSLKIEVLLLSPFRLGLLSVLGFFCSALVGACTQPATTPQPGITPRPGSVETSAPAATSSTAGPAGSPVAAGASPVAKLPVLASFYPLQEIAQRVGGDRVAVTNLTPAGAEPHELELSPRDLERLRQARLLVYLGAGFQPALEKAVQTTQAPNLVALEVSQGMTLLEGQAEDDHGREPKTGAISRAKTAEVNQADPHIWLDPVLMKEMVAKVRDALIRIDPAGRERYEANARTYQSELSDLDQEFREGLKNCRRKEIVTSHASFAYLAERYRLEQEPITGVSPETEPSPQRLREIVQFAREHDVKVIYCETLVDPKVAETIAREVGARTLVLNPIEGLTPAEQAEGKDYRALMRQNLANLRAGLECS